VRVKADTNESNTGLFKEETASKVALYPLLMLPTRADNASACCNTFCTARPASPVDIHTCVGAASRVAECWARAVPMHPIDRHVALDDGHKLMGYPPVR